MNRSHKITQYTYPQFLQDVMILGDQISCHGDISDWKPDVILALARGGLTFGAYIAHRLGCKNVITADTFLDVPPKKLLPKAGKTFRILVVDDISDSGDTLDIYMGALRAKAEEERFDIEVVSATLWVRFNTRFNPDYSARTVMDLSWIEFPWEGDLLRTSRGLFIELLSHKRQTYDPPALLSIQLLTPEQANKDESPDINIVPEAEYATLFTTSHEAMAAISEIGRCSADYSELYALGVPIISEHIYNTEKHQKYWDSYKRQLNLMVAQAQAQKRQK